MFGPISTFEAVNHLFKGHSCIWSRFLSWSCQPLLPVPLQFKSYALLGPASSSLQALTGAEGEKGGACKNVINIQTCSGVSLWIQVVLFFGRTFPTTA